MLNLDKISCRKIPLNFGLLFQNLIYIGNLSTILQLLILNKAYYLEIKIRLTNESHQTFSPCSRPCSHFGITIFEQEEGKRGIPCTKYGTSSIVSHYITLNHKVLCHIKRYLILSYYLSYQIVTSYSILSYPIVSYPILSYLITSHQTTTYQIHRHHYITTTLQTAI